MSYLVGHRSSLIETRSQNDCSSLTTTTFKRSNSKFWSHQLDTSHSLALIRLWWSVCSSRSSRLVLCLTVPVFIRNSSRFSHFNIFSPHPDLFNYFVFHSIPSPCHYRSPFTNGRRSLMKRKMNKLPEEKGFTEKYQKRNRKVNTKSHSI